MPKLSDDAAKRVADAESAGFLFEEGLYTMTLVDVEEKPATGEQVAPQWVWKFQFPEDAPMYAGRQMWRFVSLAEKAAPFMKQCFAAFNTTPDTDTDELLGRQCQVYIIKKPNWKDASIIENKVDRMLPLENGSAVPATTPSGKAASTDSGPLF